MFAICIEIAGLVSTLVSGTLNVLPNGKNINDSVSAILQPDGV